MYIGKQSVLFFILHLTLTYNCLKVIPERVLVTNVNEKYVTNLSITIRRISRGGDYVGNVEFVNKLTAGNNVTFDLVFYEQLHYAFKRSFVEFHFKACDLILRDPYIGSLIRRVGLSICPVPPGKYSFKNITLNLEIPSVWPFAKAKVEVTATDNVSGVLMGTGEVVLAFKPK